MTKRLCTSKIRFFINTLCEYSLFFFPLTQSMQLIRKRWCWENANRRDDFEVCEARVLGAGAPVPPVHELKDFWRFYCQQARGMLSKGKDPTILTLLSQAKAFKAGLARRTEGIIGDEDTTEINNVRGQTILCARKLTLK
jgi:hypothetical protein